MATISRLLKITGLFCRIYSLLHSFYRALLQKGPIIFESPLRYGFYRIEHGFYRTEWVLSHRCAAGTARSVEVETRNAEFNGNRNPEWWRDFRQLVKIEKIQFLGISRYKVELGFRLDLNFSVSRGTNSNSDFCLI